ncbi:IS5/IS1182 family transposase, partial [Enterobacter hormaechei subsp. xiangfangensis]|nr:IS5/IS1182 family transposase [Enterobacter hormaechei subsp. xiangfangensis]
MSHQLTFADSEFSSKRRQTRKEIFLSRMEQILPWQNMVEVIGHCCKVSDEAAFCLIQRPYISKTLL